MNNLTKRILSAITLAPIVLYIIYIGGMAFNIMVAIAFAIMIWEWCRMTKASPRKWAWWISGLTYIGWACICLIFLASSIATTEKGYNFIIIFLIFITIWAVDIGAYIAGKTFGKHKIAPKISPNKTWEGLIGGMIGASIILTSFGKILPFNAIITLIIAGCVTAIVAQSGDFFESWVKRKFGVKDSSNIIPGHGGLLDRLDGLLAIMWGLSIYFLVMTLVVGR